MFMNTRHGWFLGPITLVVVGTGACDLGGPPYDDGKVLIDVNYETTIDDGLRWLSATITTTSTRPLTEIFQWEFRAYDNSDRKGDPVWTEEFIPWTFTRRSDVRVVAYVPKTFNRALPYDRILSSAGPASYHFAARLLRSGKSPLTEWLPAGSFRLAP